MTVIRKHKMHQVENLGNYGNHIVDKARRELGLTWSPVAICYRPIPTIIPEEYISWLNQHNMEYGISTNGGSTILFRHDADAVAFQLALL